MIEKIKLYEFPLEDTSVPFYRGPRRELNMSLGTPIAGMSVFLEGHYKEGTELGVKEFLDSEELNALEGVVVDAYKKSVANGITLRIGNTPQGSYLGFVNLPEVRLDFSYGQMVEGAIDLQSTRPAGEVRETLKKIVGVLQQISPNVEIEDKPGYLSP